MAGWRKRGVTTRRNWWDVLAGDREGNPCKVGGVVFPVLAAARRRKGWPPRASEIGSGESATAPATNDRVGQTPASHGRARRMKGTGSGHKASKGQIVSE